MSEFEQPPTDESEARPGMSRGRRIGLIAASVVVVAALVLVALPLISGLVNGQSQTYTSPAQGYSIRFPGKPEASGSKAPNGSSFARWTGKNTSLAIQSRVLSATEKQQAPSALLPAALKAGSEAIGGKVTRDLATTTIGGDPGYDIAFSIGGPDVVQEFGVVHGDRIYVLILLNADTAATTGFVGSLTFLD